MDRIEILDAATEQLAAALGSVRKAYGSTSDEVSKLYGIWREVSIELIGLENERDRKAHAYLDPEAQRVEMSAKLTTRTEALATGILK